MKSILIFTLCLATNCLYSQEIIKHEQIAFDYYLAEIMGQDKKGTLWIDLQYFSESPFWYPKCLKKFSIDGTDSLGYNISGISNLQMKSGEKRLKIKPLLKGKYPRIYSTTSYSAAPNQIIVNIVEIHKHHGDVYHIEMDRHGKILNWCKGGWIE